MKYFFIIVTTIFIFSTVSLYSAENNADSTINNNNISNKFKMTKSPSGALWRTLAMPGWGQIYTEKYWKAPIFFTAAATLGYFIYYNNSEYQKFSNLCDAVENKNSTEYSQLKNSRDNFQNWRDQSGFYLLGVYAIAAVDAYTSAHLFDFDVNDDVSAIIVPYIGGIRVSINF